MAQCGGLATTAGEHVPPVSIAAIPTGGLTPTASPACIQRCNSPVDGLHGVVAAGDGCRHVQVDWVQRQGRRGAVRHAAPEHTATKELKFAYVARATSIMSVGPVWRAPVLALHIDPSDRQPPQQWPAQLRRPEPACRPMANVSNADCVLLTSCRTDPTSRRRSYQAQQHRSGQGSSASQPGCVHQRCLRGTKEEWQVDVQSYLAFAIVIDNPRTSLPANVRQPVHSQYATGVAAGAGHGPFC